LGGQTEEKEKDRERERERKREKEKEKERKREREKKRKRERERERKWRSLSRSACLPNGTTHPACVRERENNASLASSSIYNSKTVSVCG
jgi:hypothetical protein